MSATVTYRFARPDEVSPIVRMLGHSFPGSGRPLSWWADYLAEPPWGGTPATTLLVGEDGGGIVASCQLHPMRQWIAGESFPMCGVGSVGISPAHRRRGLGAALVVEGLRIARERGDLVSALYPFRASFYRRLGWGQADEALQYEVPPGMLPDAPERERIEVLEGDAAGEALALYGEWIRTQTGQLERTAAVWAQLHGGDEQLLVGWRGEAGRLEGYALAAYRQDAATGGRSLDIEELVWTTPSARRGLHAWIASLSDQWRSVTMRALPSHRLGDWLREPRLPRGSAPLWRLWAPSATLMQGTMFRILDVEAAWSRRRVAPDASFDAVVEVRDSELTANDGTWRLDFDAGRATAVRETSREPRLRTDISTLSRIFIGALPASAAAAAGLLTCDRPELLPRLDAALAVPEPWTFDRF